MEPSSGVYLCERHKVCTLAGEYAQFRSKRVRCFIYFPVEVQYEDNMSYISVINPVYHYRWTADMGGRFLYID